MYLIHSIHIGVVRWPEDWIELWCRFLYTFFYEGFLSQTLMLYRTSREGREFLSTTSSCTQASRHLHATLHVWWLPHINHIAGYYQTATLWVLPSSEITIWLSDDGILIYVYRVQIIEWEVLRWSFYFAKFLFCVAFVPFLYVFIL